MKNHNPFQTLHFDRGIKPSFKQDANYILKGNNNVSLSYRCIIITLFFNAKKKNKKMLRPNDLINCLTKVMCF